MRTQAAALAGHRNMQMGSRYVHVAPNHWREGIQASEQRSPHQYAEVAFSSEPSVSSGSREWTRKRVRIGVPNVKPRLTRSILLLAFAALCTVLIMDTGWRGSKILHNVSGLVGVMDGAGSDLRTGLPFQMVWVHEPMRLTFVVEGLPALVSQIVQKHRPLQKLFDNRWLHLIVLDIRTDQFVRYESQGQWAPVSIRQPALSTYLSLSRISQ